MTAQLENLNLAIELSGMVLCLLGVLLVRIGTMADKPTEKYFLLSYLALFLFAGANLAGQLMRGHPGAGYRTALYVSNFIEFLSPVLLVYIVTLYLLSLLDPERERLTERTLLFALVLGHGILLVISQFTGLYYVIDEANVYHRSEAYALSYLLPLVMMVIDIRLLFLEGKRLSEKETLAFSLYFAIPIAAMFLQLFIYGFSFIVFSCVIAAFVMFVFVLSDQTERYARQVEKNASLQVEIMLSQIQPHFLFNTLGAIQRLCRNDPEAGEAISRFSAYLRGNMDSLSYREPIAFTTELEHTKAYLELEQLRFGDDLTVVYDLEAMEFLIPTLTLQPLVENAVFHGVRAKESGRGVVTVATRELADRIEISVSDDGPGFDPEEKPRDGRSHIGLENVRERLKRLSGGELRIDSAPGRGSTVTIVLPKGK